jgi:sugar phosphate isomerase/epimerase
LAERYAEAAAVAHEHGLRFGLHNHWWECELIEGCYPYQLLHELLPAEVFFELDVYWARTAGLDPARIVTELGPRVAMLHLKDGPAVPGQPMTALGDGVVDLPAIIRAAQRSADLVVELDECATDPMDAARRSLQYLTALLGSVRRN